MPEATATEEVVTTPEVATPEVAPVVPAAGQAVAPALTVVPTTVMEPVQSVIPTPPAVASTTPTLRVNEFNQLIDLDDNIMPNEHGHPQYLEHVYRNQKEVDGAVGARTAELRQNVASLKNAMKAEQSSNTENKANIESLKSMAKTAEEELTKFQAETEQKRRDEQTQRASQIQSLTQERDLAINNWKDLKIDTAINQHCGEFIKPEYLYNALRSKAELQDEMDSQGNPTGTQITVIRMQVAKEDASGKPELHTITNKPVYEEKLLTPEEAAVCYGKMNPCMMKGLDRGGSGGSHQAVALQNDIKPNLDDQIYGPAT